MHCKVLDIFKTTIGEIAILGFSGNDKPHIGMILRNQTGVQWKIVGLGMNKGEIDSTDSYSVWDCKIEKLAEGIENPIKQNEVLYFN